MDRLSDAAQLDGWIPMRLNWSNGQPSLDWCYLGKRDFAEPSFAQTIEACLRYPANLLFRHQTSIQVLNQLHETRPGLKPAGFVFHMSRSGSSLISKLLAALPNTIVISEARPIDSVVRAHLHNQEVTDLQRINWLRWLVSALGQPRLGTERRLFIVFDSWNALELPLVRRAFPGVPWVFLYRDPLEVLVSQLGQRGAETIPGLLPSDYFGLPVDAAPSMEPEQYCASVLAAICRAALRQHADGGMLMNYSQLSGVAWSMVSEFFGVGCSDVEKAVRPTHPLPRGGTDFIAPVAQVAASRVAPVPFQAEATSQANVSERAREVASRLLYPIYEKLEIARLAQHLNPAAALNENP